MNLTMRHRWLVLLTDVLLCLLCFWLAMFSHNRYQVRDMDYATAIKLGGWYLVFLLISFLLFKSYRGLTRHLQFLEIGRMGFTLLLPCLGIYVVVVASGMPLAFPGLFSFALFTMSLVMLLFIRFWIIFLYNYSSSYSGKKLKRTLIYGIGAHSVALAQWVTRSAGKSFHVLGFVTRNNGVKKMHIQGLPVYNLSDQAIFSNMLRSNVDVLLFPDRLAVRNDQECVSACLQMGIEVLVSPPFEGVEPNGKLRFQMKPIQFEDLLGRDEISINMEGISKQIEGKVILITGAAGSIGSEIARQLAVFSPSKLVLLDVAETPLHELKLELTESFPELKFITVIGDVRVSSRLDFVFRTYKPKVVYHAAAYKHVPLMEENPCEAIMDNVKGTKNMADYSVKYGVEQFVMISTDKAVNPTNVMGASKRIAEIYVQSLARECLKQQLAITFVTTRFGNVLGSNGSVIPHFKKQIENGGPVTVTHPDMLRYFMTIPEACRLVLEAASFGHSGEIYVFDMGQPVKIVDLAKRMIEMAGLIPGKDIQIEFIGLRPGEKLYEELLNNKEETLPTENKKILVAKVMEYDFAQVSEAISELILISKRVDVQETVRAMKALVPEYHSNNSPFEQLD
jgi:FlaA1/EpsC-like NDP-sugar epimerase